MDWADPRGAVVLAVVAHPDDETLGCGGTLAKLSERGALVRVLLTSRREDPRGVQHWDDLLEQFAAACVRIGAKPLLDGVVLSEHRVAADLQAVHEVVLPHVEEADLVLTHWSGDAHQVHRGVSRAVEVATRPFRRRKDVLLFEVPTSTDQAFAADFRPDTFVLLEPEHLLAKQEAMRCYRTELDHGRRPQDLEAVARVRGLTAGAEHAEAFVTARRYL